MNTDTRCLGISNDKRRIFSFYQVGKGSSSEIKLFSSTNGWNFKAQIRKLSIYNNGKKEDITNCDNFRVAEIHNHYFLSYLEHTEKGDKFSTAISENLLRWKKLGSSAKLPAPGVIVPDFLYDHQYVAYFGDDEIRVAYSKDLSSWKVIEKSIISKRRGFFDNHKIIATNAFLKQEGIILCYLALDRKGMYSIGAALMDKDDPGKVVWRLHEPIWNQSSEMSDRLIRPLGIAEAGRQLASYWEDASGNIFSIILPGIYYTPLPAKSSKKPISKSSIKLARSQHNPIISPLSHNIWESACTFNPTAFELEGKKYILYRAIGHDNISTVGLAITSDGVHIEKRLPLPIYVPREEFEGVHGVEFDAKTTPRYMSGGGWGGCEDARATVLDGRVYLMYAAFNGKCEMDIAISSISITDFKKENWSSWTKPVLITHRHINTKNPAAITEILEDRPGLQETGEKDAAILPEKINGKYVIFHRLWPNIVIDYVDSLDFDGKTYLRGEKMIRVRPMMWDSFKISLAATPMRIDEGWLLIYNAVDKKDMAKYKLGAMILDHNDPSKVLYRSSEPILEPMEDYEMRGPSSGIVFGCGALIHDEKLFIYYGAADISACVASADLRTFIDQLIKSQKPKLKKIKLD